jgi:ubiquinone/menaquinone biosynthesis C-methylase UbiE
VFVDKLSLGRQKSQRITKTGIIQNIGKFVNTDITKTPFKNKAFDFSFCSHVLEHLEKPEAAIKEITRISRSGYIEVPDSIIETIRPRQSHLWFIFQVGAKLIFIRKSKSIQKILLLHGKKHEDALNTMKELFIRFYWKDKIEYEVIDNLEVNEKQNFSDEEADESTYHKEGPYMLIVKVLRYLFHQPKPKKTLEQTLRR